MTSRPSSSAIGVFELAKKIQTQVDEDTLRGLLEGLAGVKLVEFPNDHVEVHYDPSVVGEGRFMRVLPSAGFAVNRFWIKNWQSFGSGLRPLHRTPFQSGLRRMPSK